jgi:hypothetical protein
LFHVVRSGFVSASAAVAEIQGLYGPFSFPEKLLQKIWLRRDFDSSRAVSTDGRRVRVVHPGKWNLLGGPDFRGARLRFDSGPEITGDVELHLHARDWNGHAHARDPAYDGVVLHVVLFPPEEMATTRTRDGREIPTLALLPLLQHDLEEYAADEAMEVLANRPMARLTDELAVKPPRELALLLRREATKRWEQKLRFAQLRIERLGWTAACHHAALEVLGYRFNRSPMLRIAGRWPLPEWEQTGFDADAVFATEVEEHGWSLQGVRPANHPRVRLRQYATWVRATPAWPERLAELGAALPECDDTAATRALRRAHRFGALEERVMTLCGGAIGGTRLGTLACDAFWPLVAASAGRPVRALWFHWFPGDGPAFISDGLRQLGVIDGQVQPACHGLAQGLLGWLIQREASR